MSTVQRMTGARKHLASVLGVLLILLLWQVAAWSLPDFLMPGVPAVLARLADDIGASSFHQALAGTLSRLGAGYGLALLAGISQQARRRA